MPVAAGTTDNFPTYTLTINDTAPVYAYCRQTGHCGQGMVFVVNTDEESDRDLASFVALAKTLNGTSSDSNSNNTNGQTSNNDQKAAAPAVRASMASAALFAVGGLFVLAL